MNKKLMIYSFAGLVAAGAIAASGLTNSKAQNQGSKMPSMQQGDASMGGMQLMTSFPQTGTYKLWSQFNRNDNFVIADFLVNVL